MYSTWLEIVNKIISILRYSKPSEWYPCEILYVLSLRFNGHFPGGPGLANTRISAGFYWSWGWRKWWWQVEL